MKAKRRDLVEPELVKLARTLGAWLIKLDEPAIGDWLMWYRGSWELVEVKSPDCEGWKHEFTSSQRAFHAEAHQRGARIIIWRTDVDVLATLKGKISA